MPRATANVSRPLPTGFEALVQMHPPRVLHDEADYDSTMEVVNALVRVVDPTDGQSDYLETLTVLVEAYERVHHAIDTSDLTGADMLQHLAEVNDMAEPELAAVLGVSEAVAAGLLAGREPITADQARLLGKRFAVSPGLFIA